MAGHTAAALVQQFGARLTVLHVIPPVTDPSTAEGLRAIVAELAPGVAVESQVVSGVPARQIVKYARGHGVDLIVMGTHGRTGVSRALLGSVAEAVVRRAPCRVLTVPGHLSEAPPVESDELEEAGPTCIVCRSSSADLICSSCRARIRGEAIERKRQAERAGRV